MKQKIQPKAAANYIGIMKSGNHWLLNAAEVRNEAGEKSWMNSGKIKHCDTKSSIEEVVNN